MIGQFLIGQFLIDLMILLKFEIFRGKNKKKKRNNNK